MGVSGVGLGVESPPGAPLHHLPARFVVLLLRLRVDVCKIVARAYRCSGWLAVHGVEVRYARVVRVPCAVPDRARPRSCKG